MPYSYSQIDNIFYNDGYQLAERIIGKDKTKNKFRILTKALYENIDTLLDAFAFRIKQNNQEIHCKKACSWCCSQPVFTNDWEAEYLREFIKKSFNKEKISAIKKKAKNKNSIISKRNEKEILLARITCPLLENDICTVYSARPMACRIYLSSNLDSCIHEFNHPGDNKKYAQLYDFPFHAGRKMNEGIAAWIEGLGNEVREQRLEEILTDEFHVY
ncbi:MAG: YkgJ family cysteine cluster protein [Bacteroidota bacterium]